MSIERKVIFIWFKRFETVNKGLLRLLSVLLFIDLVVVIFCLITFISTVIYEGSYSSILSNGNFRGVDEGAMVALSFSISSMVIYVSSILIFRVLIWIYDGFVGKE